MLSHQEVALLEKDWGCGLVGGSMSLRVGFEVSKAQASPRVSLSLFQLPVDLDIELTAIFLTPCLPLCHHGPHHNDDGPNL